METEYLVDCLQLSLSVYGEGTLGTPGWKGSYVLNYVM